MRKNSDLLWALVIPLLAGRAPLNGQVAPSAPEIAVPLHYSLVLAPDLDKKIFTGEESIQIRLSAATSSIGLNAAEISFDSVQIVSGDGAQPARVEVDTVSGVITLERVSR